MAQSSRVNNYSEYIVVRREVIRTEFVVRREHAERDAPQFHDHRCERPRPRPRPRRDHHRGNHTGGKSPSEWYKIPNGGKYQKSWLLTALENMCSLKFTPVQYQVSYQWVHFFLQGSAAAEALKECSGKIVDADCRKITVYVSASPPPPAPASSPKQLESPKDSRAVAEENSLSVQLTQHLCISNNTNPAPTPSSCPVPALTPLQDNMLAAFSQQSGMNREWSQNCLQENNWDYSRAARLFSWLKAEGKIPAIAFIH